MLRKMMEKRKVISFKNNQLKRSEEGIEYLQNCIDTKVWNKGRYIPYPKEIEEEMIRQYQGLINTIQEQARKNVEIANKMLSKKRLF